ncbi:MAG: class I lanthipeptide [Candidatus Aminicenantes bacterium]|nr:class I lanthipeptide [Candidatus Aminicenantes bacterium]
MKSKVSVKKLNLNKETIADLKTGKMKDVYGGGDVTVPATPPIGCTYTCLHTCANTCATCGTGLPICPCGIEPEL